MKVLVPADKMDAGNAMLEVRAGKETALPLSALGSQQNDVISAACRAGDGDSHGSFARTLLVMPRSL